MFLVQLLSVNLLGSSEGDATIPPSIGGASTAQVTIEPNDSPQGELTFTTDMYVVNLTISVHKGLTHYSHNLSTQGTESEKD